MKTILTLLLLFASQVTEPEKPPYPAWKTFPVEHWTCPDKWFITPLPPPKAPVCLKYQSPTSKAFERIGEGQELIHWTQIETMPRSKRKRIEFWSGFIGQPGCHVNDLTDLKVNQVWFSDVSKEGFTMKAPAHHKIHLDCQGVMNLKDEQ